MSGHEWNLRSILGRFATAPERDELQHAVERAYACKAEPFASIPIKEMSGDTTLWEGMVEVFDLEQHPQAKRCYAWCGKAAGAAQFFTVLKLPSTDTAEKAVRTFFPKTDQASSDLGVKALPSASSR